MPKIKAFLHTESPACGLLITSLLTIGIAEGQNAFTQPANPPNLVYSTYIGPSNIGQAQSGRTIVSGSAVDANGYAYLVGLSQFGASNCQFLTKLSQTGASPVWSRCLGFSLVQAVAVDTAGFIYVAGDSTVMKLGTDGQQVIYSTTIAGANPQYLTVDSAGSAYFLGSVGQAFQPTSGAFAESYGTSCIVKLEPSGTVAYSALLSLSSLGGVAVDSQGAVWAVGALCNLTAPGWPPSCRQSSGSSSIIEKLDAAGANRLVSLSFAGVGGIGQIGILNAASGVAVDVTGAAWVVGTAENPTVPTTANALEPVGKTFPNGEGTGGLGFAVKIAPSGAILYGSYLGVTQAGYPDLTISSVAVDNQGRPYFGLYQEESYYYPFCGGITLTGDCTIMVLSADGSAIATTMTVVGTPIHNIALDGNGGLYVAGTTSKRGFLTSSGSYQPLYPAPQYWASQGFVAKFDLTMPGPAAQFNALVNAADQLNGYFSFFSGNGAVAPGEIVTLYGSSLPSNPVVTFDGKAAPILYASATQINTVVPFAVTPPSTVVSVAGVRAYVLPVWPDVPGLFTASGSGTGQLAALNQDGTVNSVGNPAKAGSIVSVFLTGAGALSPAIADGQTGPLRPPFPAPVLGASATITPPGAATLVEAPLLFIGQTPGLIAGAIQANLQIPPFTPSGTANVVVYIGTYTTQTGTIAVQ